MGRAFEYAAAVPWLMTEPALQVMLDIADRVAGDTDTRAQAMHGPKALAGRDAQTIDDARAMTVREGVALIPINGPIFRYADMFTAISGGATTDSIAKDFTTALSRPDIRAILFVIDSPGGEATGINELADIIFAARGQKPITAYVEGYGASAAYWIASAADEVVVDDAALIGSIGTVMAVRDPSKQSSRDLEFVSSQSPNKRPDPTTERGRASLQTIVDSMTDVFVAKVARNRTVSTDTVLSDFGQGGLFVGQQAVTAKLADRLGSEENLIAELAQRTAPSSMFTARRPTAPRSDTDRFITRLRRTYEAR